MGFGRKMLKAIMKIAKGGDRHGRQLDSMMTFLDVDISTASFEWYPNVSLTNIQPHDLSAIKLHEAILSANNDLINAMLVQGSDINSHEEQNGDTPLHVAVIVKSANIVTKLITLEADVNSVNVNGETPLHLAAASGDIDIAELLINHKCDTSIVDGNANTPLCTAILNNRVDMVEVLLSRGATLGNTKEALKHAVEQKWTAMMQVIRSDKKTSADLKAALQFKLHQAVYEGNMQLIRFLFANGAEVNGSGNELPMILQTAILSKKGSQNFEEQAIKLINILHEEGANINDQDENGISPLHLAIIKQYFEVALHLLSLNADFNARVKSGKSCLHYAVEVDNRDIIEMLVECGCDIDVQDRKGRTALSLAYKNNNKNVIRYLMRMGADTSGIYKPENRKMLKTMFENGALPDIILQPLFRAIKDNDDATLNLLLSINVDFSAINKSWYPIFEMVAHLPNGDRLCERLLKAGFNANTINSKRVTLLNYAISHNLTDVARILVKCGCSVNAIYDGDCSPLENAFQNNNDAIVKLLLQAGAVSDNVDEILDAALDQGNVDLLKTFCQHRHYKGLMTQLLHNAAYLADMDRVKLLVTADADLTAMNDSGFPLLNFAIMSSANEIRTFGPWNMSETTRRLLHLECSRCSTINDESLALKVYELVLFLIAKGANCHCRDKRGMTPLHMAAEKGYEMTIQLLSRFGVDLNSKSSTGLTPLHIAVMNKRTAIVKLLVDLGADVTKSDVRGNTLLHSAAATGSMKIARMLLAAGCDVNAVNDQGRTALYIAVMESRGDIIQLFLQAGIEDKNIASIMSIALALRNGEAIKAFATNSLNAEVLIEAMNCAILTKDNDTQNFLNSLGLELFKSCKEISLKMKPFKSDDSKLVMYL